MEKLFKRPKLIVAVIVIITVFLGIQIPRVELDNNNMRFLPTGNQARAITNYIEETFGGQVLILVGLRRPYKSVFDSEFLAAIKDFSQAA